MVFSGVIGGLLGGGASGLNIGIRTAIIKQANKAMTKSLEKNAEIVKKSGVNPAYAAATIDARGAEGVSVDAVAVQQYATEHDSLKQVAESLGVTPEQINDAAANGQDIGVTRGNLTAAIASREGFIDSIRDKISFDDGTGSVNYLDLKKDLLAANEASEQASRELDAELDKIIGNAKTAGISSTQADNLRVLLESRAMIANPTNPAEWFKKHALSFANEGKAKQARGLYQAAYIHEFPDMASFRKALESRPASQNSKLNYRYTGINGGEYELPGSNFAHVKNKKHVLTDEQWDDVLYHLDDINAIEFAKVGDALGSNQGVVVGQIVRGKLGKYGVFTEYLSNGRVFITTAGMDGTPNMNVENWIKKEVRGSRTLQHKALKLYAGKTGHTSYTQIIQNKLGIVKRNFQQQAGANTKGMIYRQDDGSYVISMFENADASTVIHEVGHFFLETFMEDSALPDADENMKRDRQKLLDYMKMTEEEWANADLEGRRAGHEKVAEAFETYFIEGKAPSLALRSVFDRFSKWLKAVYTKYVRNNNAVELTDEVRDVFAHWLAADMDIEQAARTEGIFSALPGEITGQLSDKNRRWLEDKIAAAKEKAVNKLTREYMRNFSRERRKAIAEYRAQITPEIEEQVANERVNQARDAVAEMFAGERTRKLYKVMDSKGKMSTLTLKTFLTANPNVIARKYKNYNEPEYRNMQDYIDAHTAEIDARLNPIIP